MRIDRYKCAFHREEQNHSPFEKEKRDSLLSACKAACIQQVKLISTSIKVLFSLYTFLNNISFVIVYV